MGCWWPRFRSGNRDRGWVDWLAMRLIRGAVVPGTPGPSAERGSPRGLPAFEAAIGRARLDPLAASRCGKRLSLTGRPSGEQGSIRRVCRVRGGPSRFLRQETLAKAGNCVRVSANAGAEGKGFRGLPPASLDADRQAPARTVTKLYTGRYARQRPSVSRRRSQRRHCALRRSPRTRRRVRSRQRNWLRLVKASQR